MNSGIKQVTLFQYIRWRDTKIEIQGQPLTSTLTPTHMQKNTHWQVRKHVRSRDACHIHKHGYWGALIICMIKTSNKILKGKCYLFYSWSMSVLSMTNWLQILVKTSWEHMKRNFFIYVGQEERENKSGTECHK